MPFLGIAVHIDDKQVMDGYGCEIYFLFIYFKILYPGI